MKLKMFFLSILCIIGFKQGIIAANAISLVPGGQTIGIEIRPDGLIISGTYDVKTKYGTYNPSKDSDIKRGDILFEIEGTQISSLDDFSAVFNQKIQSNDEINIRLKRNKTTIKRKLRLIKVNNRYKTGLYIKERILGIGTVSFYDPVNNIYGALGHGVVDSDSGNIVEVKEGNIYESSIKGINKSKDGNPGEKIAYFNQNNALGTILENTTIGIYGKYYSLPKGLKTLEMAYSSEVQLGKATIYTVIKGNKVEEFSINITSLVKQEISDIKGITFKINDKNLLEATGGVVAGMSGSPIIQNNKLVGAVTHVLVDNVDYGYGIYMEWMYNEALGLTKNII